MNKLNIFYEEPDDDRWIRYDRYPRKIIRRIIRGKSKPGGIMMVALQLMQGLDKINYAYRFNDYSYAKKHPEELVCIIGKPQVLFTKQWKNPVMFGPGIYSHPLDCPDLFTKYPNVKKCVVPCDWMSKMFEPYYGKENLITWPVGIDTVEWSDGIKLSDKPFDFLIYDKIRWEHEHYETNLLNPIINKLKEMGLRHDTIRYGNYNHDILVNKLARSKAVIFLCEHETQGLACQQMMATNKPILAWDRGGFWQDPAYFPERVKFEPVSSVPYWDDRCGMRFKDAAEFNTALPSFLDNLKKNKFQPRAFILENLTLEKSARKFVEIANSII